MQQFLKGDFARRQLRPLIPKNQSPAMRSVAQMYDMKQGAIENGLVPLWVIRVALQPERSQTLHIFHRRFMLSVFLPEGTVNFRLPPFAFIEKRFGNFAIFCAHHILLLGNVAIMRHATQKFLQPPTKIQVPNANHSASSKFRQREHPAAAIGTRLSGKCYLIRKARRRRSRGQHMDHRDWQLLDKQMGNLQPPRRGNLMMLILAGAFLAGITAGSSFLKEPQSAQTVTDDGKTALAFFFDGGRSVTR
jgi:hypothetical protein